MNTENFGQYEIIDAHTHIFPEKIAENATINIGKFYDIPMNCCGSSLHLIESGSKFNVTKYLVCSTATKPHQVAAINNFIKYEVSKHDCFIGLGTTHPDSDDIEADIKQITDLGLHGVKLHPDFQSFNIDDRKAYPIYEMIEGKLPVLIHCGDNRYDYSSPLRVAKIHRDFPDLKIIAAHLGGYQRWDEASECLAGLENIRFDTCSSLEFMSKEKAASLIRRYGIENCFFGTDFPMWRHENELKNLLSLGFTEKENQMILADNFKDFFDLH